VIYLYFAEKLEGETVIKGLFVTFSPAKVIGSWKK